MQRDRIALMGSILRVFSLVATTLVAFFLMPYLVHRLGDRIYGYWSLVAAVLGYYGLLDLGIVTAVQYQVAKSLGTGNQETANRAISTAFYVFACLGLIILLITVVLASFCGFFIANAADAHLFRAVLLIMGLGFAFGFPGRAFVGAICAHLRLDLAAAVGLFVLVLRTGLIVAVIGHGGGVISLAAITLCSEIATYILYYFVLRKIHLHLKISTALASRQTLKELFGYSGYALIVQISDQLRFSIDGWMVGIFVSVSAVTHYAVASRLSQAFMALIIAFLGILSPWFSQLWGSSDFSGIRRVFIFGTKIAASISTIVACSLILYGGAFVKVWMGANYLDGYWPLVLLVGAIYLDVAQQPSVAYLYGVSRHRFLAWLTLGEAFANVALSIYWARKYGMIGVALGTLVPIFIAKFLIQPRYVCKNLGMSLRWYYVNLLGRSVAPGAATAVLLWAFLFRRASLGSVWMVCLVIAVQGVVCAAACFLLALCRDERLLLSNRILSIVRKRGNKETSLPAPERSKQEKLDLQMSTSFKITAVIPTYNRAAMTIRAVNSVLQQTYPVHEIMIVDDGSTDGTDEVLGRFLRSVNTQIAVRYLYQAQQGAAQARNMGVSQATGEWIAFLDSDDLWLPEKIDWQVRALQEYGDVSKACVTDSKYTNNPILAQTAFANVEARLDGVMGIIPDFTRRMTSGKFHGVHLPTLLASRELLLSMGGFHSAFPVNEDTDLFFRLAQRTSVCYVNKPLMEIDRTPNRTTGLTELRTKETYRLEMAQRMYEKWLQEYQGDDAEIRKGICERLRDVHIGWASCQLIEGRTTEALRSVSEALRYSFSLKGALKWLSIKFTPGLTKYELLRRRQAAPPPLL